MQINVFKNDALCESSEQNGHPIVRFSCFTNHSIEYSSSGETPNAPKVVGSRRNIISFKLQLLVVLGYVLVVERVPISPQAHSEHL